MASTLRTRTLLLVTSVLVGVVAPSSAVPERVDVPHSVPAPAHASEGRMVLVISVDGLNRQVFREMGPRELPHIWRLVKHGAATRNARTEPEMTVTLPNHVGMVTGRRIDASRGGHGVTWNSNRIGMTVHDSAGETVHSMFNNVRGAGGTTAVFATKKKFSIFNRSWPAAVQKNVIRDGHDGNVTWQMRRHLRREFPTLTFLHLGLPDRAGHRFGWMSPGHERAVRRTNDLIGAILRTRANSPRLRRELAIVFTADHGGIPGTSKHYGKRRLTNNQVPFAVYARYAAGGSDLYARSTDYQRPHRNCRCQEQDLPPQRLAQPVRNGDVANVAMDVLGLPPVRGSLWGADRDLNWQS